METAIAFLEVLERDLQTVAEREVAMKPAPTRQSIRWKGWLGAAASLLILAFAVGALAQLGGGGREAASRVASVGPAVNGNENAPGFVQEPTDNAHQAGTGYGTATNAGPGSNNSGKGTASDNVPGADLTKIIRDGTVSLAIPDGSFGDRFARVVAIANTNGGSVLSSQTEGAATGTLTLRIPAARFDRAFLQVRQLGVVSSSSITGKDVTNQYIDYRAHLQNLVGRRTVLRGLLLKTTTIGESLTVENQLQDVQLQIDQIQGQLRYLNDQVAESTLTVDLREQSVPAGENETNGGISNPSLSRAWDRAVQGFFGIIATIIVGMGYLLPLAVIAGLVFGVVTLVRRRGRAAS